MRTRVLTLAAIVMGVGALAATATDPEPECVVAARWVNEHAESLPTSLEELSTFTHAYRKAIYIKLPREIQMRLWHQQTRYYLADLSLTEAQRLFITEVDAEMEQTFGAEKAKMRNEKKYMTRAKDILGIELAKKIFGDLGLNTPEMQLAASGGKPMFLCSCNWTGQGDFCLPTGLACGPAGCTPTETGCGWWWCDPCNGECNGEPIR